MVDTVWSEAQRQLRGALSAKDYEFWIAPLRVARWEADELELEVPSPFARDWIAREYLALTERAVGLARGRATKVRLVVNRLLAPAVPPRSAPQRVTAAAHGAADEDGAPPRLTFDTFVVGESNAVAYRAACAVVEKPGERFSPLFLHGGFGLGKTHLLSAIGHGIRVHRRGGVVALTAEQFVNDMVGALRRDHMDRFRQRCRRIGTLIVDDVQFLGGKKRSQEEFAHTFNALRDLGKQIVLASDRPPQELPEMEETLRSRLASGLLVAVKAPDAKLRRALVERKAAAMGLALPGSVVRLLADDWCANVRELEGALTRLAAFGSLLGTTVTLSVARELLAPYARKNGDGDRSSVARIVGEVCRHFRVTQAELASPKRTTRLAVPRQVAMYLCRRHTEAPLQAIGAEFGGRDHSTVVHALGAIEKRLAGDAALRDSVATLEARLAG